jgi:probable F420-dependent oxidoreductase
VTVADGRPATDPAVPGRLRAGFTLPVEDGLSAPQLVALARAVEDAGYDTVFVGEVAGPEVMALLGMLAASTTRVRIGSGIVAVFTRSPVLTGMGFATVSSMAPGRVVAGVGASSPIVVGQWHGVPFERPLATTRSFIRALRTVMAGGRVDRDDERFPIHGFRLQIPPGGAVPIVLGAINEGMLTLAGQEADGVFLTWCMPSEVPDKIAVVRRAAEHAGRAADELEVICSFWAYAGPEPDRAVERMRRFVLAYAMVPTHRSAFVAAFPALEKAMDAWVGGHRAEALTFVDDEVVHALCAVGDGDTVAQRVRELHVAGVDLPVVLAAAADPGDVEAPRRTALEAAEALGLEGGASPPRA